MSVPSLIRSFSCHQNLPVEIDEIRDHVASHCSQDEIRLLAEPMEERFLRAIICQFYEQTGVYAEPRYVSLIIYNANMTLGWQRVACCKELIHVLDKPAERTSQPDEVIGLVDALLSREHSEAPSLIDWMALNDRMAMYQALAILAPEEAMEEVRPAYRKDKISLSQVSTWACLPIELTGLVLSEKWPELLPDIIDP
ncbi:hypothetical protein [Rhodovibrio sodomensis]|uniref:hypothetical protein n=1 Tax=Rhodovibrio sodomensis TaxID=1088 RepID=UPI001904AE55|nr:hypothetical protein [Rhodovibrio sodomensis]